jgi:hypothetical protein
VVSRNPHPSIRLCEPTRDAGQHNPELRLKGNAKWGL